MVRRVLLFGLSAVAGCLAVSTAALASSHDPADFPLRVNILKYTPNSRHSRERKSNSDGPDYVDGMGVADLFENGEPRGFQFSSSCIDTLRASSGYETFPARWKKREKSLEILVPESGKPWNWEFCELRPEMRTGSVFYWNEGSVAAEAAALLKDWMVKHHYDPEKGLDDPATGDSGPLGASGTR